MVVKEINVVLMSKTLCRFGGTVGQEDTFFVTLNLELCKLKNFQFC